VLSWIRDRAGSAPSGTCSRTENDDERTLTVMTSRPFLDGPLSAGARRCQRRSCSLRCACSTLTPPTHRHGQHGSSNGHPRLECRQRGHPVSVYSTRDQRGSERRILDAFTLPGRSARQSHPKTVTRAAPWGRRPRARRPRTGIFRYEPSGRGICVVTIWRAAASQQVGPDRTATVKRVQTPTLSGALSARFRVSVLCSAPWARSAALLARMCMTSAG